MSSCNHHESPIAIVVTSTLKHKCTPSGACEIKLSDVGKTFHTFPKGTFKSRYAPPALPTYVIEHYIAHPFSWDWTIRSGPNKGKMFKVPTVPTSCPKNANRALKWTADLFYSFKAHLANQSLKGGKVICDIVRLYQNNMVLHLKAQVAAFISTQHFTRAAKLAGIPPPEPGTSLAVKSAAPIPHPSTTELEKLRSEITSLKREIDRLQTENTSLRSQVFCSAAPASFSRFQDILDHPDCTDYLRLVSRNTQTITKWDMPHFIKKCCEIVYPNGATSYYGYLREGELVEGRKCRPGIHEITCTLRMSEPS